jgi:hypothetical protein
LKLYALFNPAIEILTINGLNFEELGQDEPLNQGNIEFELGAMVLAKDGIFILFRKNPIFAHQGFRI